MKWLYRGSLAALAIVPLAFALRARAVDWGEITTPWPGPARVVGSFSSACISGAVPIATEGVGYQAVDLARNRYYGHPSLISFIESVGAQAASAQLGTVLVGDMAQPRGGPMAYGHISHQNGLDVDIWYRLDVGPLPREQRDGLEEIRFVDPETGRLVNWTPQHAELVHIAASDPRVTRVFVDAAIKRDLCDRTWSDRSWLRKVRPYPRHDDHMHVRLRCPADSPECIDQGPPPASEGCGTIVNPPESSLPHTPRAQPASPFCRALLTTEI